MSSLQGRRVLLTRSLEDSAGWRTEFESAGAGVTVLPCLQTTLQQDGETRQRLSEAWQSHDRVVFCSARAVAASRQILGAVPPPKFVACVGPATSRASSEAGWPVSMTGNGSGAKALAFQIREIAQGNESLLVPSADRFTSDLEEVLEPVGLVVDRITVYRVLPVAEQPVRRHLEQEGIDVVVVASPSAVEGLLNQARVDPSVAIVSIGPTTSRAAREAGLAVAAEARRPDLSATIEACKEICR